MEPIEIACPHCGGTLRITKNVLLGRKVKCPKCRDPFTVPTEEELNSVTAGDELEAVGSGVGSKLGVAVGGSSIYSQEEAGDSASSFNFTPSEDEESFEITDEDYADNDYDEDGEDEADTYYEKGYIVREENGKKHYYVAKNKSFPWDKAALIGGPIAFLIVGALIIFWSKGYFGGSGRDPRQDATRFQEFGQNAEKNLDELWKPEPDNRYQPNPRNWNGNNGRGNGNNGNWNRDRQRRRQGY